MAENEATIKNFMEVLNILGSGYMPTLDDMIKESTQRIQYEFDKEKAIKESKNSELLSDEEYLNYFKEK